MYNISLKVVNTENDIVEEFFLPVKIEILQEKLQINNFDDKNLLMLMCGRYGGKDIQKILNNSIQNKTINIKQINEIGKLFTRYDLEKAITINALVQAGKIKKWQDIIKMDKNLDKYKVIYYGEKLEKERLGIEIYNSFKHKIPVYKRSKEYREKIVDDFNKCCNGYFTEYGYLVKDFEKINAKCTNKGFEIIEKSKGGCYEEE